jgi:hypothetical protein
MALADNALTTLATVKTELSITGSSDDAYLERLIDAASAFIASYCRREFHSQSSIAEKVAGHGGKFLTVAVTPITTLTSISYDGSAVGSDNYEIHDADAGLIYALGAWVWTADHLQSIGQEALGRRERKLYTVTYDGGYVTPEQGGSVTLPKDLEDACISLVVMRYRQKGRDPAVKTERLMEASIGYAATSGSTGSDPLQATAPWVYSILQRYMRHSEVL